MKHYLATLACLLFTTVAQAQVHFGIGPVGAYTLSTGSFRVTDNLITDYTTGYHSDFAAGLLLEAGVGHFALQPSLQFARKGYSQSSQLIPQVVATGFSVDRRGYTRLNYLALPVNFVYTQRVNGQGIQVFAGPYLSTLLGGNYNYFIQYQQGSAANAGSQTITSQVVASDTYSGLATDDKYYTKKVDFGLQGGVGYRYQGLLLQLTYSAGLRDLAATNFALTNAGGYLGQPTAYYNRGFQLSLAYLVGPKF